MEIRLSRTTAKTSAATAMSTEDRLTFSTSCVRAADTVHAAFGSRRGFAVFDNR